MAKEKTQSEPLDQLGELDAIRNVYNKAAAQIQITPEIDPLLFLCGMVAAGGEKYAEVVVDRAVKILKELDAYRAKQAGVTTNT